MRSKEFLRENEIVLPYGKEPMGMDPTPQNPPAQLPAPDDIQKPVYADNKQLNSAIHKLQTSIPHGKFDQQAAGGAKRIRSIRAKGINVAQLKQAMTDWGAVPAALDPIQSTASSSFPVHSFIKDNVLYTIVIGMKGAKTDTSIGIARKELTPAGLGINGGIFSKDELIKVVKQSIANKFNTRDPLLAETLNALIDNAATGGNTPIAPESMSHINEYLGIVSQDFGEILAPILIMKPGDKAELPTGNHPLVDVKLHGMNMSVKALTGSGTSFRAIHDLMDKYEASITQDTEKQDKFKILKQFHPSNEGNNKDKIIAAASTANIPEYQKLMEILGTKNIKNFKGLSSAVSTLLKSENGADYSKFLNSVYPAMIAGQWGKPVGLPADGNYYLGKRDTAPKSKAAGKPSFDANPVDGGADILTYVLGVGLLNYITKGEHANEYKTMMTDIVKEANAVIGHITINSNGTLKLITKPFSEINFEFQYHAPSHIPGNNLPGFIGILD